MGFIVREAKAADAKQLICFVRELAEEPEVDILLSPGEFKFTPGQERKIIAEYADSQNSRMLIAEFDGEIIGVLHCKGGEYKVIRHRVTLGMSVREDWRNKGVGTALLTKAIEWARSTGIITRLELGVYARNETAIRLYKKFGFQVEGRKLKAFYRNGEYLDELVMALLL
jgi:putative acetyltransferase